MGIKTDNALLVVITFLAIAGVASAAEVADHVFLSGKIVTVDKRETVATAMAVGDGKIIYVGDDAGARALGHNGGLHYYRNQGTSHLFREQRIFCLFEDQEGSMWFGSLAGLYRLKNGAITDFGAADGLPEGN